MICLISCYRNGHKDKSNLILLFKHYDKLNLFILIAAYFTDMLSSTFIPLMVIPST